MKKFLIYFSLLSVTPVFSEVSAQENFTVMCYNVLNFPNGQPLNRQDTLKKIINHVQPDILFLQELKSEAGLNTIAEQSFSDVSGTFQAGAWVSQQSNPNTSWPLQQNVVYNSEKFTLHEQQTLTTNYRDFNLFVFYLNSENLQQNADTAFLYCYVTHLKSSQGEQNEQKRLEMVQEFTAYLENIPEDAQVILAGDFNLYSSTEPAYELLLSDENPIRLEDPIDMPGTWSSSAYPDKSIMTQSTRTSQLFNDGAGGGVDDRFDFMLCSSNMLDGSGGYQYIQNSYYALGNNGDCYNSTILNCASTNFTVPESVMTSLYYMSDHLPVVMQISSDESLTVTEDLQMSSVFLRSNVFSHLLEFTLPIHEVVLMDIRGKEILRQSNIQGYTVNLSHLTAGVYLLKADNRPPVKVVKI